MQPCDGCGGGSSPPGDTGYESSLTTWVGTHEGVAKWQTRPAATRLLVGSSPTTLSETSISSTGECVLDTNETEVRLLYRRLADTAIKLSK